ncbi:hypothetical protein M3Y97_00103600 [Aphelenchoides bicaudatus]|nr:hypothetical protein M3Y97_00103600 [Aphelenchoides bicaudatus]
MQHVVFLCIIFGVANALNCYQGIQNASLPISGSATACPTPSLSCLKSYDNATNTVTRSCQTTNCTLGGVVSSTGFCQNTTSYPYQTYCCCYNDGCNSAPVHSALMLQFGWMAIPLLALLGYVNK